MDGFLVVLFSSFFLLGESQQKSSCGYDSCHPIKDGYVNVHIFAHTHNDVGWVRTVDDYYHNMVRNILTSSYQSLQKDKNRRFMYVESAYLFKWWDEQIWYVKNKFKELINNGQLELVGGGWSINDEATTNYQSIIDQMTLGLSNINKTFGPCGRPKVGWQIDVFGHSKEMASIFTQLGFDGLFLGEIDYQDQNQRFKDQTAEMIWQTSNTLGQKSEIFTHILYNSYDPPLGACWDSFCNNNFDEKSNYQWETLTKFMDQQRTVYKTNNIILTMGGDFHYTYAEKWFKNLDALIKYGNNQQQNGSKYNFLYSTPSCYLKAVHEEASRVKIKWPIVTEDFFPYATNDLSYWAGFYTSRPTLKRFERIGNNYLQLCKQLYVMANLDKEYREQIDSLKEAMGVLQHHNAITGTEEQNVANDYAKSLSIGIDDCEYITYNSLNVLIRKHGPVRHGNLPFSSCLLNNISECTFTKGTKILVVTVYNPLSRNIDHYVRIPVIKGFYSVHGSDAEYPFIQMIPIPKQILIFPGRKSKATFELVFKAANIPPLGFKSYYIRAYSRAPSLEPIYTPLIKQTSLRFGSDGFLTEVTMNNKTIPIKQEYFYYQGPKNGTHHSNPYIFLPEGQAIKISNNPRIEVHDGHVMKEIHQVFNSWVSQIIRIYPDESFIEFQWLIGPFPRDGTPSKEVISRFTTDLKSESTFYTDSNGRQMIKRLRLKQTQPIAGNYYPVTSKILIRDPVKDVEVAILTDRAQGGTSLNDGEIELMVHRRTSYNVTDEELHPLEEEAFGMPLIVRGSHYLVVGPYLHGSEETVASVEKDISQRKLMEAWIFISPTFSHRYQSYRNSYNHEYSGLNHELPKNIQILTLEALNGDNLLLRLEHIFEKDEDPILSKPVDVDIENLFAAFKIVDLRETTLGGNQWLDESKPMKFGPLDGGFNYTTHGSGNGIHKFVINLGPMQIRTFVVRIQRN